MCGGVCAARVHVIGQVNFRLPCYDDDHGAPSRHAITIDRWGYEDEPWCFLSFSRISLSICVASVCMCDAGSFRWMTADVQTE